MPIKNENNFKMGKAKLIEQTWERLGKKVTQAQLAEEINAFLETIEENLVAGNEISLLKRFSFYTVWTQETVKPNLRKPGESITVPAQRRVKLRVSDEWKRKLNPILQVVSDLKRAQNLSELEKIYKTLSRQEVYKNNKKHIDRVYSSCETNLKTASRK